MEKTRAKLLMMTPEAVLGLLMAGEHHYRVRGLPEDTRVVRCFYDDRLGEICLVVGSSEFEVVPDGYMPRFILPELEPIEPTEV